MLFRFDPFDQIPRGERTPALLAMDAVRNDDHVYVYFDAPGVTRDDLELTVEKNAVTVEASRRWYGVDNQTLVTERPQGSFRRHIQFGDNIDLDGIEAELADGVLTLTVPVREDAKSRTIDVRTTGSPEALEPSGN